MKNLIIITENNLIKGKGFEDCWTPKISNKQEKKLIEVDENNLPDWVTSKKSEIEWDVDNNCVISIKPENKIIQIRNKAREKFLELKNDLDNEEKRKVQLFEIDDWSENDESYLLDKNNKYKTAISDYKEIKNLLMSNIDDLESCMSEVKEKLNKYNINI